MVAGVKDQALWIGIGAQVEFVEERFEYGQPGLEVTLPASSSPRQALCGDGGGAAVTGSWSLNTSSERFEFLGVSRASIPARQAVGVWPVCAQNQREAERLVAARVHERVFRVRRHEEQGATLALARLAGDALAARLA